MLISGLGYLVVSFLGASLRSEGLKLDIKTLKKYFGKCNLVSDPVPHIVVPLQGRFIEHCHLLP